MAYILIFIFICALIKEKYDIWKVEEELKEQNDQRGNNRL